MPSPFPGMDPYLESHWRDVHHRLITYASDAIQDFLPPELRARVEERVVLETPEGLGGALFPDARVIESGSQRQGGVTTMARWATGAILFEAEREPLTEGYIELINAGSGNRVVTIIEVLSPANKTPGDSRIEYQRKQRGITKSSTNLVEIDLLRGGKHVAAVPLDSIGSQLRAPYMVCVRRATMRTVAEVYLIHLTQQLPTVHIPLRPGDADVPLDLQALIEQCYRKGCYEGDIDYRRDPDPTPSGLPSSCAAWACALVGRRNKKRKGKRRGTTNGG